ncbi:bifunctional aspartokinase/homoserine dehydrogenase 2 [Candidatus Photodesmus blepharus]|uniref:Aspartokinase n=1 Tax=Candidatus Photodesmus blepharonis TaxID=1179155 RepID=A0A084CN64_9GAMM|nr:bifunctional aspartokinase/homoserine dehydrogenase 2 [Candidatus Photodesmus blepharus]
MTISRQLHKFGGNSLATPECYQHVVQIIKEHSNNGDIIVVSASGKTTDFLIKFVSYLRKDKCVADEILQELYKFHTKLVKKLLKEERRFQVLVQLGSEFNTLRELVAPLNAEIEARVLGYGEIWSARLLAAVLCQENLPAINQDSRDFLRANLGIQPEIDLNSSYPLVKKMLVKHPHRRLVITGFMARDKQRNTVLLGRNGSDYSATAIGILTGVYQVTIWSDVAGVYSADPYIVNDAHLLPCLGLDEADELARLATPVLHSRTLQPVAQSKMHLHLRSSYQPKLGSTRIERTLSSHSGAKVITSLDEVLLIQLTFNHQKHNLQDTISSLLQNLKSAQLEPLTYETKIELYTFRLAYTTEKVNAALSYLQNLAIDTTTVKIQEGYSLIAAVGSGIVKNLNHCHDFYQQLKAHPIEFISESQSALSLVAILRNTSVSPLVIAIHNQLFQIKKQASVPPLPFTKTLSTPPAQCLYDSIECKLS